MRPEQPTSKNVPGVIQNGRSTPGMKSSPAWAGRIPLSDKHVDVG